MDRHSASLTSEETLRLQTWRTLACDIAPYYSTILFSLRPVRANHGTFGVDRSLRLYIDFTEVSQWGDDACAQVLLHECGHIIGDHAAIAEEMEISRDPQKAEIFNIAADMAINDDLADMGMDYIAENGQLPRHIGAPDHLTSLEYYARIVAAIDEAQSRKQDSESGDNDSQDGQGGGGQNDEQDPESGDGDGQGGDSQDDGQDGDGDGGESGAEGQPTETGDDLLAKSCGSVAHGAKTPGELDDSDSLGGEAMGATQSELDNIIAVTREKMHDYAQSHPGSLTAAQVAEAENKGQSLISWKRELSGHLTTTARTNRPGSRQSYRRTSRRYRPLIGGRRIVMPGRVSETFNVGCIIDTSASTRGYQAEGAILREVHAIHQRVSSSNGKTFVIDADTEIHDVREYRNRHSITTLTGQGGTLMGLATDAVLSDRKLMTGPDRLGALVIITDGETGYLDTDPQEYGIPVIACIVSNDLDTTLRYFPVPDWMTCVKIPAALV